SARWAPSNSSTPTRAPAARIDAASRASRPVRRSPSRRGLAREAPASRPLLRTAQHLALTHSVDVLADLEDDAERLVQFALVQREQRLGPGDRLAHPRQLVELLAA